MLNALNSFQLAFIGKTKGDTSLILHVPIKRSGSLDSQVDPIHRNDNSRDNLKLKCSSVNRHICEPFLQELLVDDNILTKKSYQTTLMGNTNQIVQKKNDDGEILVIREEIGIKIALLFALITNENDVERIDRISGGIRFMHREELYYWYAKAFPSRIHMFAIKALKILLLH